MIKNRFAKSFPIINRLLSKPVLIIYFFLFLAFLGWLYSPHLALSIYIFAYVLLTYSIERRHLNTLFFTPLTALSIYAFLGLGIGSVLLIVDAEVKFEPLIFLMQVVYLVTFPFMMIIYRFFNINFPSFSLPDPLNPDSQSFYKPLKNIAWCFFIYAIFGLIVGAITGSADRGEAGEFIVENQVGIWSIFVIFNRLNYVSFILIPFLLRDSKPEVKYIIYFLLTIYFVLAFATGSRGFVLHPIVQMVSGYWMFGGSSKIIKRSISILIILALFLIPFMDAYRNTSAFYTSALSNPLERLQAITEAKELFSDSKRNSNNITGLALVGASDYIIYENTPSTVPYAGWENIEAILYIWVPNILYPSKPLLLDGDEIIVSYTGIKNDRSSGNISFYADMYRRFGWFGVFIGYIIFAIFYSRFIAFVFRMYYKQDALFGFLLILLCLTFLQYVPNNTLLTTFWIWLWDIPKYVLALMVLHKLATFHHQVKKALPAKTYILK
jgi:hypothetical protein